ncbi:site-specific DNA-methyltransferase [Clostridium acetireducens]|nr:site-specific DNA-methyltransferase [Clostridium acetireducens]
MDGYSLNIVKENIGKLKEIFPEVFCEDKVDFERLQEVLGEYIEDKEERYRFEWHGKSKAIRIAQTPSRGTLRPCKEESKNWDTTENLYIEGDNLEVLKLLQKSYQNKIKMIYIDPPYNTGNDFVYKDDYKDNLKNYLKITGQVDEEGNKTSTNSEKSGRYHTDWLNMMYPRLRLARNLLKEDGVIFISIDNKEVDNLRKMCHEIFGEGNYVGEIIWETATDNNATQIAMVHEYILCYAKNSDYQNNWIVESEKAEVINNKYLELKHIYADTEEIQRDLRKWINSNKKNNKLDLSGVEHYNYVDEKGVFYPGNPSNTSPGDYYYDIIHPITKKVCSKPENGYRWPENTFWDAERKGDVLWGEDESTIPKIKKRINTATELLKSYYYEDNRISTKYLSEIMGEKVFDNPKSVNLLKKLIRFISFDDDDIILDFFSGSASTADAIIRLNLESNKYRKFILIQLPEDLDESSKYASKKAKTTIKKSIEFLDKINKSHYLSEIGKERIRRAGDKIIEENKDKEGIEDLDIGFKVFKLDSSNIKPWNPSYEDIANRLDEMVDNFVPGRTEEDVVYEIMLKYGIDLTYPIEIREISGKKVFSIGFGALIICLDNEITLEVVNGIVDLKNELNPETTRIVFKDNGFKTDSVKTNAIEILKRNNINENEIMSI